MDDDQPARGRGNRPSGLAALGVVLAAVLGWWVFSGNGPQGPSGNDARYAVPDVDATAAASGVPSSTPEPAPGTVPIESYVARDELRITVNYLSAPGCTGALGTPQVIESDVAVTITLPVDGEDGTPCADPSEQRTLAVLLDSPLDGRAVLDGSRSPQVRVEPTTAP